MPQTDIVMVQFRSRYNGEFAGPLYTYITEVPLCVGDIVKVPTIRGDSEAQVARIDVPQGEVKYPIDALRRITEPATPGGGLFDDFFN